jgi:hypothetical protein
MSKTAGLAIEEGPLAHAAREVRGMSKTAGLAIEEGPLAHAAPEVRA